MICSDGIKIYEFKKSQASPDSQKIELHLTDWRLPIKTDDIDQVELAKRVRFESNNMIRFLTRDDRDILFHLDPNGKNVHYHSEVKLENNLTKSDHYLASDMFEEKDKRMI